MSTGSPPTPKFAVTTDAGRSWADRSPRALPFDSVVAMAATSGGTLYVASSDDSGERRVFRSTDTTWTRFTQAPEAAGAYQLLAAGDRIVGRRGTTRRAELFTLDDAGHTERWAVFD